jgi:hypothetical protein
MAVIEFDPRPCDGPNCVPSPAEILTAEKVGVDPLVIHQFNDIHMDSLFESSRERLNQWPH